MIRAFVVLILLALIWPALAHDDAAWIAEQQLRNRQGEFCCGPRDCSPLEKTDYTEGPNGYVIGGKETIPYSEALPFSIDGRLWICRRWDGHRICVFDLPPGM